jgi:hypothetical protein
MAMPIASVLSSIIEENYHGRHSTHPQSCHVKARGSHLVQGGNHLSHRTERGRLGLCPHTIRANQKRTQSNRRRIRQRAGDNRRIGEFGHEHSGADRQDVERHGSRCIAKSHLFPKHWSCSMTFTTHIAYSVEADGTMERRGPATVSD